MIELAGRCVQSGYYKNGHSITDSMNVNIVDAGSIG